MFRKSGLSGLLLTGILLLTGGIAMLLSQTPNRELIHSQIDENRLVALRGNTRPEVQTGTDLGAVSDDLHLDHMMLQLKRSDAQEKEVDRFIDELHNPNSPNFHKWLSSSEFGERFGVAATDIRKITGWLESHGLIVNSVYPNNMSIDFSGNAGQVREAFHTTIHNLDVNGQHHIANFSDPQIPEALNAVVAGVVSLHDFKPHAMSRARRKKDSAQYTYADGTQSVYAMVPADLATIYDFNPLFANGVTGKGQTVVVIEDTNLYRTSDWTTFRSTFGLSQYSTGTLTTVQPAGSGVNNCVSPGVTSDDEEAILDVEWASAAAPGAAIELASCADTNINYGLFIATQNVINSSPAPAIVSISYGQCEAYNGSSANQALSKIFQQAVAEGTSVFVSSGDEDAASCDALELSATHGIGVSGFAATPYNVAVGGTDFGDVYAGNATNYWGPANSATYGSALSYIPEIPWNDSCANGLLAKSMGYSTGYGSGGFCASAAAKAGGYLLVAGGSGGPSGCATGTPAIAGVVGGSCQGAAKPSWQTGVTGIPNDGVRDIPDVSIFASDGFAWNHYSVICFTDTSNGGAPCRGAPSNWAGVGGTSLSSPVMAGVQALINQSVGSAQGNPNVEYYKLAAKNPSVFHTVTQGDIDVNCGGTTNCFGYVGTVDYGRGGRIFGTTIGGVLSTSDGGFQPAYTAGSAWNFASGLGSVDVNALVINWGK
jgi:subtilase family serine protease